MKFAKFVQNWPMKTRRLTFPGEVVTEVLNPPRQIYRGVFFFSVYTQNGKTNNRAVAMFDFIRPKEVLNPPLFRQRHLPIKLIMHT